MRNRVSRGHLLLWIFAASGFSGLVYQSIWTQYLGLFLGHSSHAQSLVLMLFMGGMALGAWLVSRHSEKMRRPLLAYAVIEMAIGIAGLFFDPVYQHLTQWAYQTGFPWASSLGLTAPLRWALAVAVVLPQCILLGATFPLMSAGFMRLQPRTEGRVLAGLYFSNSMGAAIGALTSAYVLLPAIGLPGAMLTAGLLSAAVALLVYPLSEAEIGAAPLLRNEGKSAKPDELWLVLWVAGLTGLTSFIYEITWVRMLSLALGTTLHTFELMLAAFIAGIAFGGLWLRGRSDRLVSPLRAAGRVQVWMGLAALLSLLVYAYAFEWVGWLMRVIAHTSEGYSLFNIASGVIAVLVMFPTAFFAGMTLPLLTLALLRSGAGERAVGRVYAINTLGAIAGVLLAIHLLLPWLGVKFSLWIAAAIDLCLGLIILTTFRRALDGKRDVVPVLAAVTLSIVALLGSAFIRFDPLMMASSVFRLGRPILTDAKMIYYRDGKTATVAVYERHSDGEIARSISTNGKVDAAIRMSADGKSSADEYTMTLLAALPMSMKPSFERVGVIGFGSGMTTHTLLGSRRVGRVDTVEIEPFMIEGARHFGGHNARAFSDPRSHIVVDDAKAYFAASGVRYDLIVSEPSNPWMGGTASLFTEEFYSFVPRQLTPDGLFVQWVQLYEISPQLVSSILRAMLGHFHDVQAYVTNTGDLVLVASPNGQVPKLSEYAFQQPQLASELGRLGIRSARELQDGFVMNRRGLEVYTVINPFQANSDFFPVLQLNAPVSRFKRDMVTDFDNLLAAPWPITRALGGAPARGLGASLSSVKRPTSYDPKLRAAREILWALGREEAIEVAAMGQVDVLQVEALRGMAASCRLDEHGGRAVNMMMSLAMETVPFLDAEANATLWSRPSWLKCPPKDQAVQHAIAFISAAGQDDPRRVIEAGIELLEGPAADVVLRNTSNSYFVWGALQTALVALDDPGLARDVQRRFRERIPQQIRDDSVIRWTSAMAALPREHLISPAPARE